MSIPTAETNDRGERMKVYLSGPMTGRVHHGIDAFLRYGARLTAAGYDVLSPAEHTIDLVYERARAEGIRAPLYLDDPDWYDQQWSSIPREVFLRMDAKLIADADAIAMLPGWESSVGANWEIELAATLGLEIRCVHMRPLTGPRDHECESAPEYGPPPSIGPTHTQVSFYRDGQPGAGDDRVDRAALELVVDEETGARKADAGKARMDLLPYPALEAIAQILTFGATKYAAHNWRKGFAWSRIYSSLQRHLGAWSEGEDADPETGKSHLWHAGCNILFLIQHELDGLGTDDRYKKEKA